MTEKELKDYEIKTLEAKKRILTTRGDVPDDPGIYVFWRIDEDGIRYAYVGQAQHLLTRLAQHLLGHDQHIDLSIKSRGLYSQTNRFGWRIHYRTYKVEQLDEKESQTIKEVAKAGMQLYNIQSGGHGGRHNIQPGKPAKTYRDGVKQGYENARREIAKLFKKNLKVEINGSDGARKQIALKKFHDFLTGEL